MGSDSKFWKGVDGINAVASVGAAAAAMAAFIGIGEVKEENRDLKAQVAELTQAVEAFTGVAAERATEALESGAARIEEFDTEAAEEAVRERANEGAGTLLEGAGDRFRNFIGGADAPAAPGE